MFPREIPATPITLLMADDDEDDRLLTKVALERSRLANDLRFVEDGEELMDYLRRPRSLRGPGLPPPGPASSCSTSTCRGRTAARRSARSRPTRACAGSPSW